MSSILKALKKIENETQSQKIKNLHIPRTIDTKEAVNKRVKGFWIINKVFFFLIAGIAISSIIWFVSSNNFNLKKQVVISDNPQKEQPVIQKQAVEEKKVYASLTPSQTPEAELKEKYLKTNPFQQPVISVSENKKSNKTQEPEIKQEKILKKITPANIEKKIMLEPVKIKEKSLPKKVINSNSSILLQNDKQDNKKQEPIEQINKPSYTEDPSIIIAHRSIPEKTSQSTGLEIQALVWSEDNGSRMAVINGSILRTGGTIDGTIIKYIGNDYIIFQKGASEWKMMFQVNDPS